MLGCDGRTLRSPLQVRLRRLACRFEVRASDRLIFLTFQQCECLKNVGFFNLLLAVEGRTLGDGEFGARINP